ncbi:MAG: type II toxin-antitoxin system RelE/ParE family toxin [Chitinispirillales bacterium]|jgi:mRNA-degrading endonuclease RelE of RelBE toxin-antitoxin system|nr:type II toxin-antitoxin system RelE/ParE family toxin [Chitinispirillales bacterium]
MNYNIITTPLFEKELKRLVKKYASIKQDYAALLKKLQEEPQSGESIGNDCYKVRLAIKSKNKGKSGGARVITFLYTVKQTLYLLGIYDKTEKETLKDNEIKARLKEIAD